MSALSKIESELQMQIDDSMVRWYSVKVFERDERIDEFLKLTDEKKTKIEPIIKR